MFSLKLAAAAGLVALASAQSTCSAPDNQDICAIEGAMGGSQVVPNVVRTFTPTGVMRVHYDGIIIGGAQQLTPTRTADVPLLQYNSTEAASGPTYIFMMFDPDAGANANVLHYMLTDCQVNADTLYLEGCTAVAPYGGPAPPQGTGEHRYIQLLFTQPAGFVQPSYPETIGTTRLGWSYDDFVATNGLEGPVGGMFFKSQYDTATIPEGSDADPNTAGGSPTDTSVVVSARTGNAAAASTTSVAAAASTTAASRAARTSAPASSASVAGAGSRNAATASLASATSGAQVLSKVSAMTAVVGLGLWAML